MNSITSYIKTLATHTPVGIGIGATYNTLSNSKIGSMSSKIFSRGASPIAQIPQAPTPLEIGEIQPNTNQDHYTIPEAPTYEEETKKLTTNITSWYTLQLICEGDLGFLGLNLNQDAKLTNGKGSIDRNFYANLVAGTNNITLKERFFAIVDQSQTSKIKKFFIKTLVYPIVRLILSFLVEGAFKNIKTEILEKHSQEALDTANQESITNSLQFMRDLWGNLVRSAESDPTKAPLGATIPLSLMNLFSEPPNDNPLRPKEPTFQAKLEKFAKVLVNKFLPKFKFANHVAFKIFNAIQIPRSVKFHSLMNFSIQGLTKIVFFIPWIALVFIPQCIANLILDKKGVSLILKRGIIQDIIKRTTPSTDKSGYTYQADLIICNVLTKIRDAVKESTGVNNSADLPQERRIILENLHKEIFYITPFLTITNPRELEAALKEKRKENQGWGSWMYDSTLGAIKEKWDDTILKATANTSIISLNYFLNTIFNEQGKNSQLASLLKIANTSFEPTKEIVTEKDKKKLEDAREVLTEELIDLLSEKGTEGYKLAKPAVKIAIRNKIEGMIDLLKQDFTWTHGVWSYNIITPFLNHYGKK